LFGICPYGTSLEDSSLAIVDGSHSKQKLFALSIENLEWCPSGGGHLFDCCAILPGRKVRRRMAESLSLLRTESLPRKVRKIEAESARSEIKRLLNSGDEKGYYKQTEERYCNLPLPSLLSIISGDRKKYDMLFQEFTTLHKLN
jgi:hypothetical protein